MISNINLFTSGARKVYASHLFYLMVPILGLLSGVGYLIAMPSPGVGFGIWSLASAIALLVFYIYFLCKQANGMLEFSTAIADEGKFPSLMFKITGITAIVMLVLFVLNLIFVIVNAFIHIKFITDGLTIIQLVNLTACILFFASNLAGFIGLSGRRSFPNHNAVILGVVAYSLYFVTIIIAVFLFKNMGMFGHTAFMRLMSILLIICIISTFVLSAITWNRMSKTFLSNQNFAQDQNPYGNNPDQTQYRG